MNTTMENVRKENMKSEKERLEQQIRFITEVDKVKNIFRQTYLAEVKAADRIFGLLPADQGTYFRALWEEFEAYETAEAKFAHLLDNFQPLLLNDASDGKSWAEHGVHKSQVCKRNERIPETSEIVWEKMLEIMDKHIEKGNLNAD